ncbi:MAG: hypothetical protein WCI87_03345 [Euryarchaeota archaeon]
MRYIRIIGAKSFMELTRANVADWQLYGTTFREWKEETGKDYGSWVSERVTPTLDLFDYLAWYEDGSLHGYEGGYSVILDPSFGLWTGEILARAKKLGLSVEETLNGSGCWIG